MREYTPEDFPQIKAWYAHYGTEIEPHLLPNIGFISDHAACFLVVTNSAFCFLEPLVGDPLNPEKKREDLDKVIEAGLAKAKALGYKSCYAFLRNQKVLERVLGLGFKLTQQNISLIKEL